jgi:2-oxoisovalerate dehydrogenase E1 component
VAFAEAGTWEPVETLTRHVVAEEPAPAPVPATPSGRTQEITYREAVKQAIRDAMIRDERVFLMGEDVGAYGGCYAVTKGMMAEFGETRIRDTPLSESGFTGFGIGAAAAGMRPIVELMTVNFSLLALDQIMNTAATIRHMSGGQFGVPLVIRMATGAGKQLAAQHSHSLEGWYGHIPGPPGAGAGHGRGCARHALDRAAGPRSGADLRKRHALQHDRRARRGGGRGRYRPRRDPQRGQGREPDHLWRLAVEDAGSGRGARQRGHRGGSDRSAQPQALDDATIMASIARTRRAVVVDEGWRSGSISAEIIARINEQAFWNLDAPLGRVCAKEVPIPYPSHLEAASIPQVADIVAAARAAMGRDKS